MTDATKNRLPEDQGIKARLKRNDSDSHLILKHKSRPLIHKEPPTMKKIKKIAVKTKASQTILGANVGGMDQAHRPGIRNLWAGLHMKAHIEDPARSLNGPSVKIEALEGIRLTLYST